MTWWRPVNHVYNILQEIKCQNEMSLCETSDTNYKIISTHLMIGENQQDEIQRPKYKIFV